MDHHGLKQTPPRVRTYFLDLGILGNYYRDAKVFIRVSLLPLEGKRPTATAQQFCAEV